MVISWHVGHYCNSQGSQLYKIANALLICFCFSFVLCFAFFSPAAFIALSCTMKAYQQGESFLTSTNLISPCPVTNMFGIFGSMVLLSISGEQTKTIACVDLELCMTSDQQLEESLFIDKSILVL